MPRKENIWNKIKKWFENRFIHPKKALQQPSEERRDIRKHYRVTTVDQMTREELNQAIKDRDYLIEDDVIFAEILKRIGANPELVAKTIANRRAKHILTFHLREGELVQLPNGRTIFEDVYTIASIGDELPRGQRTIISSDGTSIGIKNTEPYSYYQDCKDERPVSQVNMMTNKWNGITLQNVEEDKMEKQIFQSLIAYDNHSIEMEKRKEIYHTAKGTKEEITVERLEDKPFAVKETWAPEKEEGQTVFYGMVEEERPDFLYSDYFVSRKENYPTLEKLEENYQTKTYREHLGELSDKNREAAYFFHSLCQEGERE